MPPDAGSSTSIRIPVDLRRFPGVRRLAADYVYNFPSVAAFFAGDPSSPEAWRDTIGRTQMHPRSRDRLVETVIAQQQRRGAPPEAIAAAQQLQDPRSVAVVTGQQAGLFGGPMFTLLKTVTALRLAEQVRRQHDVPVVAVFWIDAEDHDWEEVRTCGILDRELSYRAVSLPSFAGAGEAPVAALRLDGTIQATLDDLESALGLTEFTSAVLARLRQAYAPGVGMAEAFGRWLESLFGSSGLIVFDGSDGAAKPLAADIFARELRGAGRSSELAGKAGAALKAQGYHAQVTPHPDSVALFHLDGARRPIRRRDDELIVGETATSAEALANEANRRAEIFSPNVLLRPIVQDTLFPTVCYVAGPNELAYLGQLRGIYEHFGVPMPLMYPRLSATLLDAAAARFLTRYDLPLELLQPQDESALNRLLASLLPASVEVSLEEAARATDERMQAVIASVPAIDPTLEGAARSTLGRMQHELQTLHAKVIHAAKRRDETLRRQFIRAKAQAFPDGQPQERVIGFVYFLNRYGPALIDRLSTEPSLEMGQHWVLTI